MALGISIPGWPRDRETAATVLVLHSPRVTLAGGGDMVRLVGCAVLGVLINFCVFRSASADIIIMSDLRAMGGTLSVDNSDSGWGWQASRQDQWVYTDGR